MTKCPLCGNEFDESIAKGGCASCNIKDCGLIRCPNCGYEFPAEKSKKKGFFKSLFKKE